MNDPKGAELIYDWNLKGEGPNYPKRVMITDETLRDGLQSPSVTHPSIQDKVYLLYLMRCLEIDAADLRLCGAEGRFKNDVTVLAREIANQRMPIVPQSAARSMEADIAPIAEASQAAGIAIEACIFLGSSPIRQYAEGWDVDTLLRLTESSVTFAVQHGLPVMFVTEDTSRANPETLKQIYACAIRSGAHRICAADTVGHATPQGVRTLIGFLRQAVDDVNPDVGIDWHGHRDRGLDIINSLAAIEAGADRVHACALGIGERSGNTPMEILLVNLNLMGLANRDLRGLPEYCQVVSQACGVPIPFNYPIVGADSFRTATGVHAAAIAKADDKHDEWLADRVYCGVPASMVGRTQGIEIGPMSGEHNVRVWLKKHDIEPHPVFVEKILAAAKRSNRILSEEEIHRMTRVLKLRLGAGQTDVNESDLEFLMPHSLQPQSTAVGR
jgi:2-isopropylmalate synthase